MPDQSPAVITANSSATAIEKFATFAAESPLTPSASVMNMVRDAVIDILGCTLLGTGEAVAINSRAAYVEHSAGPAIVYGTGMTAAPETAAFLNATAAHALDFDDWELPGNTHPSVAIIPAVLAATAGRTLTAMDLVEAYVVGFEVIARLGEVMNFEHYARGWHSTATLCPIGAAAAVSRAMKLDRAKTGHAMAIAASRASGFTCQFGSNTKPLQAGFAAQAGVVAARLASHGLTGQPHVLDAPNGFHALLSNGDMSRFEEPMSKLGDPLALEEYGLLMKFYPSCSYTHRIIACALDLRARGLGEDPARIRKVRIKLPDFHAAILPFRHPNNRIEALFSLPNCAAQALTRGDVTLADLDAERWKDPVIRSLIDKSEIHTFAPRNPNLNYDPAEPDELEIEMDDGTAHKAEAHFPIGSPGNPAPFELTLKKFRRNAGLTDEDTQSPRAQALERLTAWPGVPDLHRVLTDFGAET